MGTRELVNVSEVIRIVCDMKRWTQGLENVFQAQCVTGEIIRFSPALVGSTIYEARAVLVFWVELLRSRPWYLWAPVDMDLRGRWRVGIG
jgi:hypothetical protein